MPNKNVKQPASANKKPHHGEDDDTTATTSTPNTVPQPSDQDSASSSTSHKGGNSGGSDGATSNIKSVNTGHRNSKNDEPHSEQVGMPIDLADSNHGFIDPTKVLVARESIWNVELDCINPTRTGPSGTLPVDLMGDQMVYHVSFAPNVNIVNEAESFINYEFVYRLVQDSLPDHFDTVVKEVFGPSITAFRFGTEFIRFAYNEKIRRLIPARPTILHSYGDDATLTRESEFMMLVLARIIMDRDVLCLPTKTINPDHYRGAYISHSIPSQTFVSPILRLSFPEEPIWYNDALLAVIQDRPVKFGQIKMELDNATVRRKLWIGLPIDQFKASLYNFNLLEFFGSRISTSRIASLIKALSYEYDDLSMNALLYQNIPEWADGKDLSRMLYCMATVANVNRRANALNLEYFTSACVFSVKSGNAIIEQFIKTEAMDTSVLSWLNSRDRQFCVADLNRCFAMEITPIVSKLVLSEDHFEYHSPIAFLDILEMAMYVTVFPNTGNHVLACIQKRVLEIMRCQYPNEHKAFLNTYGYSYYIDNGNKIYRPIFDVTIQMSYDDDYVNGTHFPSLFTNDPSLAHTAPTISAIAKLFIPKVKPRADELAIAARFPRFPNATHLNPYTTLLTKDGAVKTSHTANSLRSVITDMFVILTSKSSKSIAQKQRTGIMKLQNILLDATSKLGASLDGHVYHLFNIMANMPHNCIPNTDGEYHSFRPCTYAVTDGAEIYPIMSSLPAAQSICTVYTEAIWTLLGGVNTAFADATGSSNTANLASNVEPLIPSVEEFLPKVFDFMRFIGDICNVEGLLLQVFSEGTIAGYEQELAQLRNGLLKPHVSSVQFQRAREVITKLLGASSYDFNQFNFQGIKYFKNSKLLNPRLRRVRDGVVLDFQPTLDPVEFVDVINLMSNSTMHRFKIGLKMVTSCMNRIKVGIILHKKRCNLFDPYAVMEVPATVVDVVADSDIINIVEVEKQQYYNFIIDGHELWPNQIRDVNFIVNEAGTLNGALVDLLISALTSGLNVYITLKNLMYIPHITTSVNEFLIKDVSPFLTKNASCIHDISFFDNTSRASMTSDRMPAHGMPDRLVWNLSVITDALSCRGIATEYGLRSPHTKMPLFQELDMGTINETNGECKYSSGARKTHSKKISMFNQVLSTTTSNVSKVTVQFNMTRKRRLITHDMIDRQF